MKFQSNNIKLKSNWFDKDGKVYKVGHNAFLVYLSLYRYQLKSNDSPSFVTSISQLKKETGYTMKETYDLVKLLIKHKMIETSVTRWSQYADKDLMIVTALDLPQTERSSVDTDNPVTSDDFYVPINLELVQVYIDKKFKAREIVFYCLARKYSNNSEGKFFMSINKIAIWMRMSTETVIKMIRQLNRERLLSTYYKKHEERGKDGIKFEHWLLNKLSEMDAFNEIHGKNIDKNIKMWDKENAPDQKLRAKNKAKAVDVEAIGEDVENITKVEDIKIVREPETIRKIKSFGQPRPASSSYDFDDEDSYIVDQHDSEELLPF